MTRKTKRNAGPRSKRKSKKFAKKALRRLGYAAPKKARTRSRSKQTSKRKNPVPKLRPLKTTGWMNASAVKIIRNRGKVQVLVRRKPKSRRR